MILILSVLAIVVTLIGCIATIPKARQHYFICAIKDDESKYCYVVAKTRKQAKIIFSKSVGTAINNTVILNDITKGNNKLN